MELLDIPIVFYIVMLVAVLTLIMSKGNYRKVPSLLIGVYIFYFMALWMLLCQVYTNRDFTTVWNLQGGWIFNCEFKELKGSKGQTKKAKDVVYMLNHITAADYLCHNNITDHRASSLSSHVIAIYFPTIYIISLIHNNVWFFWRGGRG
jgi:hypothetical protein